MASRECTPGNSSPLSTRGIHPTNIHTPQASLVCASYTGSNRQENGARATLTGWGLHACIRMHSAHRCVCELHGPGAAAHAAEERLELHPCFMLQDTVLPVPKTDHTAPPLHPSLCLAPDTQSALSQYAAGTAWPLRTGHYFRCRKDKSPRTAALTPLLSKPFHLPVFSEIYL